MRNVLGTSSSDELFGFRTEDSVIAGFLGDDSLFAGGGNDTLNGGPGDDRASFDIYFGSEPLFTAGVSVDLATGSATAQLDGLPRAYSLISIENLEGSDFDDTLAGDASDNVINAGDGDDRVLGQAGNDILFGEDGEDSLFGGAGDDSLFAGVGSDVFDGGNGFDKLDFGTFSRDVPIILSGVVIDAAAGEATATVEGIPYTYSFSNIEWYDGSTASDVFFGSAKDERFNGASGDDEINAGAGDDILLGDRGNDTLNGDAGDDELYASVGFNEADGGAGFDFFGLGTEIGGVPILDAGGTVRLEEGLATYEVDGTQYTSTLQNIENMGGSVFGDHLVGDNNRNEISGRDGDDLLIGKAGNDYIFGGSGSDTIKGGAGDDFYFGEAGNDIALFDGRSDHFTIQIVITDGTTFIEDRTGVEGTDSGGANVLRFSDRDVTQSRDGRVEFYQAPLAYEELEQLAELYIAYFDRAPDAIGLKFWAVSLINDTTLDQAAEFFFDQPETQALYGALPDARSFVTEVYNNVLGRGPDASGLGFWTTALSNGSVTYGQFIREFLAGARAEPTSIAEPGFAEQQANDQAFLNSKTEIGLYFGATLGMSDVINASNVMDLFDGSTDSVSEALNLADTLYQDALATDGTGEFLVQLIGMPSDNTLM